MAQPNGQDEEFQVLRGNHLELSLATQEARSKFFPNQGTDLNLRATSTSLNACEHYPMTARVSTHVRPCGGQPQLLFPGSDPLGSLETGFLTVLEPANYCRMAAGKPKGSTHLCLPRTTSWCLLICGFGGWNSGLCAFKASTLQD